MCAQIWGSTAPEGKIIAMKTLVFDDFRADLSINRTQNQRYHDEKKGIAEKNIKLWNNNANRLTVPILKPGGAKMGDRASEPLSKSLVS